MLWSLAFALFPIAVWFGPARWLSRWYLRREAKRWISVEENWLKDHPNASEEQVRSALIGIEIHERQLVQFGGTLTTTRKEAPPT